MPFKGVLDGQEVISFLLSEEQWERCRAVTGADSDRLLMSATGLPCYGRTSTRGLRHFAHRAGYKPEGETAPETWQHLTLKKLIAEQALAMGWDVDVEAPAPGREWVADTMMTKDGRTVVFEAQWSRQDTGEYARRQRRYAEVGIECWWVTRHDMNGTAGIRPGLPMVPLVMERFQAEEQFVARIGDKDLPVAELVTAVLEKMILDEEISSVLLYPYTCWRCHQVCILWQCMWISYAAWEADKPEASPWVRSLVEENTRRVGVPLALLQTTASKAAGKSYMAFSCPRCRSVFGDNFLMHEGMQQLFDPEITNYHQVRVLTGAKEPLTVGARRPYRRVPPELTARAWERDHPEGQYPPDGHRPPGNHRQPDDRANVRQPPALIRPVRRTHEGREART